MLGASAGGVCRPLRFGVGLEAFLAVGADEVPRHAGYRHARLEQQRRLDGERRLVVKELGDPAGNDELRYDDVDQHIGAEVALETPYIRRIGLTIPRRGSPPPRVTEVEIPVAEHPGQLLGVDVEVDRPVAGVVEQLGVGESITSRLGHIADEDYRALAVERRWERGSRPSRGRRCWVRSVTTTPGSKRSNSLIIRPWGWMNTLHSRRLLTSSGRTTVTKLSGWLRALGG